MKIRNGWVGNSSSSSFIIVGNYPQKLVDKWGTRWLLKLNEEQKKRAIERAKLELNDEYRWFKKNDDKSYLLDEKGIDIYLTSFISDASLLWDDLVSDDNEYTTFPVEEGSHGYPYDEEEYEELVEDEIWLRKEQYVRGEPDDE